MKHHFEFSKVLAMGIGILFAAAACFCAVTWLLLRDLPLEIMDYVDGPFMIVVSSYMAKSGVENVAKIRNASPRHCPQVPESSRTDGQGL